MQSAARWQKKPSYSTTCHALNWRHIGGCRYATLERQALVKKSLTPAAVCSAYVCENSRFLSAYNVVPSTRMVLYHPGAFLYPGQRHQPCCRSPPLSFRPRQNLNERKMQDCQHHRPQPHDRQKRLGGVGNCWPDRAAEAGLLRTEPHLCEDT